MTDAARAEADLRVIAAAVAFDGDRITVAGTAVEAGYMDAPGPGIETALAEALYHRCYIRPRGDRSGLQLDRQHGHRFQAALMGAEATAQVWESGWRWESEAADGLVVVSRNGVWFWTDPASVIRDEGDGADCLVLVPTHRRRLMPGYHAVAGSSPWDTSDRERVRVYWNTAAGTAPLLLRLLHRELDDARVPFTLKTLRSPEAYRRADAAVLYLPKARYDDARKPLAAVYAVVGAELHASTPLLTKRLAPGLGLAEDPGGGQSFGRHRCQIAAAALLERRDDDRSAVIASALRAHGLDPLRPYLSPGSRDGYALVEPKIAAVAGARSVDRPTSFDRSQLLDGARRVGDDLCATAIWNRDRTRCTWLGRSSPGTRPAGAELEPRSLTLGPDLYGGASGIALFLAELGARTGDPAHEETARGALACALNRSDAIKGDFGFYSGATGVAWTAARVATILGEPVDGSAAFTESMLGALKERDPAGMDLIAGRAGAVLALLHLARDSGREEIEPLLDELGAELAEYAEHAYRDAADRTDPPLAGLSHGAAGVGTALLVLAAWKRSPELAEAGRLAIDYEQQLFDPAAGNWPDLREFARTPGGAPFMTAWCHGAPGIGLARTRAAAADPAHRARYREQALTALRTTREALPDDRTIEVADVTYCHGAAGLVEALFTGGRALEQPELVEAAERGAMRIARLPPSQMRSGAPYGGANPSLMIGTSGVGYLLLRLAEPESLPSILIGPWSSISPQSSSNFEEY